ncbi:Uncharacterised protein [Vibrio cholerae]|nr:Uncharacterised protein [Vibrio cholerae]CSI45400.1 Uncharacterised protein [Vibrio cholerae]
MTLRFVHTAQGWDNPLLLPKASQGPPTHPWCASQGQKSKRQR